MFTDLLTVAWKEIRELLFAAGNRRGGWTNIAIMIGVTGLLFPLQSGHAWFTSWLAVYTACFPVMTVVTLVADSVAGERERHTLETLLASRLPDRAIVLGKLCAAAAYGWGLVLLSQPVTVIALNLAYWQGYVSFYRPEIFAAIAAFGLLISTLFAALGVLVSMGAATVRQAGQRMLLPFIAIYAVPGLLPLVLMRLPPDSLTRFAALDVAQVVLSLGAALILTDVVLCGLALARFRRVRLVLT